MFVYGVYESIFCKDGERCSGKAADNLRHVCATREKAQQYLEKWISNNPKCEIGDSRDQAVCYYDECFCEPSMNMNPVSETTFIKNGEYGGWRSCYIAPIHVEK